YGSVITHIEPHHVSGLRIPRFRELEQEVHEKVSEAAVLRSKYQSQIRGATQKLFESVGLEDITPSTWHNGTPDVGFVRKIESAASLVVLTFNPRFFHL